MIGDLFNNNKRKDVVTRVDQMMRYGKKWRQDKKTGYYICCVGDRKRLHVEIWEREHGIKVPPGCIIHHLDWDKTNNSIENLICVYIWEHEKIHNIIGGEQGKAYGYSLVDERDERGLPPGFNVDKYKKM